MTNTEHFDNLLKVLSDTKEALYATIKDPELDINLRWSFFKKLPKGFLGNDGYGPHLPPVVEEAHFDVCYAGNFHVDRYATYSYVDLVDKFEEYAEAWYTNEAEKIAAVEQLKRYIINKGFSSFTYDW